MKLNITGKNICRERNTIHPTIATRIFTSKHMTFALSFSKKNTQTSYNNICFLKFPTNPGYIEKMKYINEGDAWAALYANC
jgi:hypothetical protein